MLLYVWVNHNCVAVPVGDGTQSVRWLANVGVARQQGTNGQQTGLPVGVKLASGISLHMQQSLAEAGLHDEAHCWVELKSARLRTLPLPPSWCTH